MVLSHSVPLLVVTKHASMSTYSKYVKEHNRNHEAQMKKDQHQLLGNKQIKHEHDLIVIDDPLDPTKPTFWKKGIKLSESQVKYAVENLDVTHVSPEMVAKLFRVCGAFQYLNALCERKVSQIPSPWTLIKDCGVMLNMHRKNTKNKRIYVSQFDITQAYNSVTMTDFASYLCNVITSGYKVKTFIRAPFGLSDIGNWFCGITYEILKPLSDKNHLISYSDDILIISPNQTEH